MEFNSNSKRPVVILLVVCIIGLSLIGGYFLVFSDDTNNNKLKSTETIGYWNGMYYDENIPSKKGNLVPKEDLDLVKNRAIARIERIRNEPMQQSVNIKVITREEFKKDNPFQFQNDVYSRWSDSIWFAQLIVPGQIDTSAVRNDIRGNQTLAYYLIQKDTLVLVVEPTENGYVRVDGGTLAHELTHAMQDQRIGLQQDPFHSKTTTYRQAQLSLVEGEAQLVEEIYRDKCASHWDCFDYKIQPTEPKYDMPGYQSTAFSPYYAGKEYIANKYQSGGWDAVDKAYTKTPPITMQNIIYPDQKRTTKRLIAQDISEGTWEKYNLQGYDGRDSLGVVGISSMLYHYEKKYGIETGVENADIRNKVKGGFEYENSLARDLKFDSILPYSTPTGKEAFVWTLVWDNNNSADKFTDIYGKVLLKKGGSIVQNPQYKLTGDSIEEHKVYSGPSEFQGYFSVARNGNMVVITYAESQKGLENVRPTKSEPLALQNYQTGHYTVPTYEVTKGSTTAKKVSDDSQGMSDYMLIATFFLIVAGYIIFHKNSEF